MTKGDELQHDVENERLYEALRAWCKRGVEIATAKLEECADAGEFKEQRIESDVSSRGWSYGSTTEDVWSKVVIGCDDALTQVSEYGEAIGALTGDERISRQLGEEVWVGWTMNRCPDAGACIRGFLVSYLGQGSGAFEEAAFDTLYAGFEKYFYGDRMTLRYLAPLGGFEMEAEQIVLAPGLSIVGLEGSDRAGMLLGDRRLPGTGMYPAWQMGLRRYAFELFVEVQKRVGPDGGGVVEEDAEGDGSGLAMSKFHEVRSALRLFKEGDVGYDWIWMRCASWVPAEWIQSFGPNDSRGYWPGTYVLSAEEASKFEEFWQKWHTRKRVDKLDLAVRRFNMGCERRLAEDRLIDYVIGLEALLLVGAPGEYGYRMSLRGAALLGEDPLHRAAVRSNLEEAYRIRGKIVHGTAKRPETADLVAKDESGGELTKTKVRLDEFVELIAGYLRSLVGELGRRVEKKELRKVMDDLNDAIAKGFASPQQP